MGTETSTEKVDSRRDQLAAAFEKAAEPKTVEPVTAQPNEPVSEAKVEVKSERPRDESGKFVEKKASGAPPTQPDAPKVEAAAVSEAKAARKYPSTWKRDYEPVYRKLETNPEYAAILDEIERRESDHLKQISSHTPTLNFAQQVKKVLEPYQQTFQQMNIQPEQAIQHLLAADHALRTAPANVRPALMMQLMQGYGIDPASLQDAPKIDPTVYALQNQLQETRNQVNTFMSTVQQQYQQQADMEVEKFKESHPHFELVRQKMGDLVAKGAASGLEEAYEIAVYADPALRGKMLAEQQAKAEADRRQKEQLKVEQAKSAGVQVKGAPTGGTNSTALKAKDRRGMLEEAFNRLT